MSNEGSGTRSGSADWGGCVRVGTFAGGAGAAAPRAERGRPVAQHPGTGQHWGCLTTVTFTVAVASLAGMWNSRTYSGLMASVT